MDKSSTEHLLSRGCAAHSRNWEMRLEVMRPPSCRMTSGRTAGQTSSLSSSTWSKCCRIPAGRCPLAPILRPASQWQSTHRMQMETQRWTDSQIVQMMYKALHQRKRTMLLHLSERDTQPLKVPPGLLCCCHGSASPSHMDDKSEGPVPERTSATKGQPRASAILRAAAACSARVTCPTTIMPLLAAAMRPMKGAPE